MSIFKKFFNIFHVPKIEVILDNIHENTWEEAHEYFGQVGGIHGACVDTPTHKLSMGYSPQVISREKVIELIKGFGYPFHEIPSED